MEMPPYDPTSEFYSHISETNKISAEWHSAYESLPKKHGWYLVIFQEDDWKVYVAKCYFDGKWDQSVDQVLYWTGGDSDGR